MSGPIDHYEVRWRPADSDGEWESMVLPTSATTATIKGVDRSGSYIIEARSIGPTGLKSAWIDISHTVAGNSVPEVPSAVSASATADGVKLAWTYVKNLKAGIDTCIERALSSSGPWTEITQTRARTYIATERVDGTFYYRLRSVDFNGTYSGYSAIVSGDPETLSELNADIASALETAQNAQATADGSIVTFWQTSAPVIGSGVNQAKVGDIWFDTDDGNKIYRVVGSSWVLAADDDLAQALAAASTAQATADGKVKTYFSGTAPGSSGLALGDLWFNTTTKQLYRWSGSNWNQNIADVTLDQLAGTGVNVLWEEYCRWDAVSDISTTTIPAMQESGVTADIIATSTAPSGFLLRIINTSPSSASYIRFAQSASDDNLPMSSTTKYLISFYARSNTAGHKIQPIIRGNSSALSWNGGDIDLTTSMARYSVVADLSGFATYGMFHLGFFTNRSAVVGREVYIDRVMIEPMLGTVATPSNWVPGPSARRTTVAINNAATAQATADGKIDSFYQASPPTVFSEGDIWFDTNDGNKIYTARSGSWVATPDSDIALAINAAAGAQATADGKVKTFYQSGTPSATGVGDLWFNTTTKVLTRWSGSSWVGAGSVPDSSQFTNGVINDKSYGNNLITNPSFADNIGAYPQDVDRSPDSMVCDGWVVTVNDTTRGFLCYESDQTDSPNLLIQWRSGTAIANSTSYTTIGSFQSVNNIQVVANQPYYLRRRMRVLRNVTPPAGVTFLLRTWISWFTAAGVNTGVSHSWDINSIGVYDDDGRQFTSPVNASYAKVSFTLYVRNTTGSTYTPAGLVCDSRIYNVGLHQVASLDNDVSDGAVYGRLGNDDLFVNGGVNRIGLRFSNSGHRLGSQKNFLQIGAASVRNTTALSATSAGVISVNAHTVRYGSFNLSYSAVSSAITGKAANTSWVVYCLDPDFSGGAQTWLAVANPDSLYQQGDGVYIAGVITIPASGSSSGGGGSAGGGPGEWCVDVDSVMPDGSRAGDVEVGDDLACCFSPDPKIRYLKVTGADHEVVHCWYMKTQSGAGLVASESTPMVLRDGSLTTLPEMLGQQALVLRYNVVGQALKIMGFQGALKRLMGSKYQSIVCNKKWENVTELFHVGLVEVTHIKVQNQCYYAGRTGDAFIATHNPIWEQKP